MIAIDNKYRLMSQMSHTEKYDIWEALDLQLEKKIVVEIFNDSKLENKVKEKVQQYAQINHPSLISVHTAGMFQNQPYIVLDYAEGKSLNAYMKDTFNNWKTLALFFKQITEGIHVLHEHKMGHHNLTANQIYIRPNNEVIILMDFPKLILEEQQLFLFDDVMALGEMLQTFLTEARVPAKLLEIVQKTKQCRLIEYTTEHILQDIEEFLQSNQPKFVDVHSTLLFFNKWGLLSILLIIVSCVIFKYAYDHGAFKKRVIQFIPKELKEEDILKLFDNNFDTQKQPKVDNEANKIEKPSSSKNNRKVFPIQQESMQEELESNENNFQVQPKPMTKEELERREKLSKIQKQYDELMQVIKEKKNKLRKYNQNYEELEKQKLVLTREIEKSQSKLERLSKQKDGAQRQYKTLEEQINLRKKEYQKSTNLWNKYQVSFQKTEKDIQNLQDNIEKAKQDKFELEKKLSNLQAKHRELEISMQSKKKQMQIAKNNADNFSKNRTFNKNRSSENQYQREYSNLKSSYNQKERDFKKEMVQIQRLNFEIERSSKKIRALEKNVVEKQDENKRLERIKNDFQNMTQKQEKLERIKKEIEDLSVQHHEEKEKERSLNEELNEIQTDLLIRKEYCDSLQSEIKEEESKAQQLKEKIF